MKMSSLLLPSSVGLLLLSVISWFSSWNSTNISVPISTIFLLLSLIVFIFRSALKEVNGRLAQLEDRNKS